MIAELLRCKKSDKAGRVITFLFQRISVVAAFYTPTDSTPYSFLHTNIPFSAFSLVLSRAGEVFVVIRVDPVWTQASDAAGEPLKLLLMFAAGD
jgi:hypothetical protein